MQSLWNDAEAQQYSGDLAQRVYTSRLLGRDKSLVMHGGGNTSVKIRQPNIFGREEDVLYVKGSGWDLETIEAAGFAPVKLAPLLELATLPALSDTQMANELRVAMTDASAPSPSVEAILHAILPHKYVDHTHADAVISVTNSPNGRSRIEEIYSDSVVIIPYVMPGFKLARSVAELFPAQANSNTIGMILLNHGLFSFGATAQESYERMIDLVNRVEEYLKQHNAWRIDFSYPPAPPRPIARDLALLRKEVSALAGAPMIMSAHTDAQVIDFLHHENLLDLTGGPLTPDHVLFTKRIPLIGRDVQSYAAAYQQYFDANKERADQPLTMLDAAPRVILDPEMGLVTVGRTAKQASVVEDIYRHTMEVILRANVLGGYEALPAGDIFDVEYWDLEQAKARKAGKLPVFTGEIGLVTGAASGIGKACVEALLARGAAVIGLDINPAITDLFKRPDYVGIQCDVTNEAELIMALEAGVRAFGGLDIVVLNAGVFPPGTPIAALKLADWDRVMRVNLDANLSLLREAHPLLKAAPRGGRVGIVASKNVPAPGPGAAAYSASKAALNQLGRVAALEWGGDGIRVNMVHPNAVFDTGLWTEDVLVNRAKHYGMTVEQYKTNNVLKVEVTSRDVAELVAEMCGPTFAKTTGAQVPVDGGNDRVI
ncbi:MAG: bifunctional aldolase/short-chain dehydrogenase [Chloroflexota bacterium]